MSMDGRWHRIAGMTAVATALGLSACGGGGGGGDSGGDTGPTAAQKTAVITNYADIAAAVYADALTDAEALQDAIDVFLAAPSVGTLNAAKQAWAVSRESYQQSEVFRFDEGFVSSSVAGDGGPESVDGWEGQVNAWPLDEALIDYVDASYSGGAPANGANIINSDSITVNGEAVDVSTITKELLAGLNEIGGSEANVATGYHAIEFLLWGQDLSQAASTAGQRPFSDFVNGTGCTNGNCDRRREYLEVVTALLVDDLTGMAAEWDAGTTGDTLRADLLSRPVDTALTRIFYGLGSLALGELASERMRVARIANSPEDEHDCFSDTSHNSYFFDGEGVANVYLGEYNSVSGASLSELVALVSTDADEETLDALDAARTALSALKASGDNGQTFDYLIDGNDTNLLVQNAEESLIAFTEALETGAAALGISVDSDCGSTLCDE